MSEPAAQIAHVQAGVYQAFRWWGVGTHNEVISPHFVSLSSVPVVGCRNGGHHTMSGGGESIKRSGGGVSEHEGLPFLQRHRVYQAFRWWGVGTCGCIALFEALSLSSVPVVGCRNGARWRCGHGFESIKRSGGGVSERNFRARCFWRGVYQAFRWWGVGTHYNVFTDTLGSLSSVPVVGCRNLAYQPWETYDESIKRSGGGVSELLSSGTAVLSRVYQAFRWWGVGTGFITAR